MTEPTVGDSGSDLATRPLRDWRAERLLSIRDLARVAGVAPSTVYLIETGRTTPRPSVMRRIASMLAVDAHRIAEFRRAIEVHGRPQLGGLARRDLLGQEGAV